MIAGVDYLARIFELSGSPECNEWAERMRSDDRAVVAELAAELRARHRIGDALVLERALEAA